VRREDEEERQREDGARKSHGHASLCEARLKVARSRIARGWAAQKPLGRDSLDNKRPLGTSTSAILAHFALSVKVGAAGRERKLGIIMLRALGASVLNGLKTDQQVVTIQLFDRAWLSTEPHPYCHAADIQPTCRRHNPCRSNNVEHHNHDR
jgi:hypothetical protein